MHRRLRRSKQLFSWIILKLFHEEWFLEFLENIAGHTATSSIVSEREFHDVWHDRWSHYYIDGGVERSGIIPVLVYDEKEEKYYSLKGDLQNGRLDKIRDRY